MLLTAPRTPLVAADLPLPEPGPGQLRIRVAACGVCRTDLHVVDGELPRPKLPLVLGHEVVGRVDALGAGVTRFAPGRYIGCQACGRLLRIEWAVRSLVCSCGARIPVVPDGKDT